MFVMDYYGHKLSNGVLFAHHLILDVPGGSFHLGYRRRVRMSNNPPTRVNRSQPVHTACSIGPKYSQLIDILRASAAFPYELPIAT